MSSGWLWVALLAAVVLVGCSEEVDRDTYVEKNIALLETVPVFPGARLGGVESVPYKASEQSDEIAGYGTIRDYAVPAGTRPSAVIALYRRALRRGWRIVDVSRAPSLSFRKGDAYLHVLAGAGGVDVEIDHDCYKGGASPECF